ncbi:hypothetical protein Nm8I071_35090 [Nonomuraea sp. TT08I-71]|nr:hypothetical protein Nm8I071_35090 [Nonomuraea sp. TT08I-71]
MRAGMTSSRRPASAAPRHVAGSGSACRPAERRGHHASCPNSTVSAVSTLGGLGGILLGAAVTAGYGAYQGWPVGVLPWATGGALAATIRQWKNTES